MVRASVPLATPTQWRAPRKAANSDSKASTSGPRMYCPERRTSFWRAAISSNSGSRTGLIANSGTLTRPGLQPTNDSTPALQQILIRDLAHAAPRHPHDDAARGDVGDDDRAGGDKGLFADLDRRTDHDPGADPAGAAQQRPFELELLPMAVHRVVVGEGHAGPDKDVVLDHRAGREVAARLHA